MMNLNEKLKRIAELGTELVEVINTGNDDMTLISFGAKWNGGGPQELELQIAGELYKEIQDALHLDWTLWSIYSDSYVTYHFIANFCGIWLLTVFREEELPEELKDQVEAMKKAQSAATDKAKG